MVELANTIVESMPGAYGTSNVQCFSTAAGDLKGIGTNSQLAGNYPRPDHAGAPGTKWLIEESFAGSRRSRSKAGRTARRCCSMAKPHSFRAGRTDAHYAAYPASCSIMKTLWRLPEHMESFSGVPQPGQTAFQISRGQAHATD
jgi:hypothetical protein